MYMDGCTRYKMAGYNILTPVRVPWCPIYRAWKYFPHWGS